MSVTFVEDGAALLSMRNSDFDAYSAFGEVVDNSIQAGAKNVKVRFWYQAKSPQVRQEPIHKVAFGDDGSGMPADILHRCLQLGYSSRYNDRGGIGRFGVGATLAAINQCKRVEVYSKTEGGTWLYTYVDLDEVTSRPPKMLHIPEPIVSEPSSEYRALTGTSRGTVVVWSKYDRQASDASEIIQEFRIWAGRTYRKFIWNQLALVVNGEIVPAIDPLYATTAMTRFPDDPPAHLYTEMTLNWPIAEDDRVPDGPRDSIVRIRMSLLPESLRPTQGSGNSTEAHIRSIDRNGGISILRNDREVYYDVIPWWPGETFKEIDRWWGCEICFDAVLDKEFTVKNIKRGALPVKQLKQALASKIEPTRKTALEAVRGVWLRAKAKDIMIDPATSVDSGHSEAERVAQNTPTPKSLLDRDKNLKQEASRFAEEYLQHANEQSKAAWTAKFQGQPYTILDAEWKGPEFVEVNHLGGNDVLRYNMRHHFFRELEDIRQQIRNSEVDAPHARQLKLLIDLLLISYSKAEAMFNPSDTYTVERLLEQLRMNWGQYLSNYIDTHIRTNSEN